jgi:hypothetical protein
MMLFPLVLWVSFPRSFASIFIYSPEENLALGFLAPLLGVIIFVGGGMWLGVLFATSFQVVYQTSAAIILAILVCVQQGVDTGVHVVGVASFVGVLYGFLASRARRRDVSGITNDTNGEKTAK